MSRRSTVPDPGAVMSYGLRLANRGYDRHQIVAALVREDQVLELQRSAGAEKARHFAELTAERALERTRSHPHDGWRTDVLLRVVELREAADSRPWLGRTGPTDRRVLEGGFRTATICKSIVFGCALRTWSLRVGVQHKTVSLALGRLIKDHRALRRDRRGSSQGCAQFRLLPMSETGTVVSTHRGSIVTVSDIPAVSLFEWAWLPHDAFRNRALGDSGWAILRRLSAEEPLRPSELTALTGIHRERVYETLGRFQGAGLSFRTADGWVRKDNKEIVPLLDAIAKKSGTFGALDRDRDRYERHRREREERLSTVPVPDIGEARIGEVLDTVGELLQVHEVVKS